MIIFKIVQSTLMSVLQQPKLEDVWHCSLENIKDNHQSLQFTLSASK